MELFRLDGKAAIVTGAAQGLGAAVAEGFAQVGCRVMLADVKDAGEVAKKITMDTGQEAAAFKTDVSREDDVRSLVEETQKRFGRIDILVNNAGTSAYTESTNLDLDKHWWPVMKTNLTGALICTREAVRYMIKNNIKGTIINTSSVHGIRPSIAIYQPAYYASKAALNNLTRAWALEYGRYGIRVNAVAPGLFRTPLTDETLYQIEEVYSMTKMIIPLARGAEAEEIKGPYIFLASKASEFITGIVLLVDGGMLACLE